MVTGAKSAPICAPELKMLVANALSFFGKNSAVDLMAAGKLPASPKARINRAKIKRETLTVTIFETSLTAAIASFAPAKLKIQLPVSTPDVKIPQKA